MSPWRLPFLSYSLCAGRLLAAGIGSALAAQSVAADQIDMQAQVQSMTMEKDAIVGPLAAGGLIVVHADGSSERIAIVGAGADTPATRQSLPALTRPYKAAPDSADGNNPVARGVADGRIIVAGGMVQKYCIAVLQENSMQADAADTCIGIGNEWEPARHYEIYDPVTQRWHTSSFFRGAGGTAAILDDGRVVKTGLIVHEKNAASGMPVLPAKEYVLEISNRDGSSRQFLQTHKPSMLQLDADTRPFVIQDELFLVGHLSGTQAPVRHAMEWFNAAESRWEMLWMGVPSDNPRQTIVRRLANGKNMILPLPTPVHQGE